VPELLLPQLLLTLCNLRERRGIEVHFLTLDHWTLVPGLGRLGVDKWLYRLC
jgi:hypothetical protein